MVTQKKDKQSIQEELSELLNQYYDGSFARLVQEYIRTSGMSEEEREALVEIMKHTIKK
jgi:predicted transcriptional regulator